MILSGKKTGILLIALLLITAGTSPLSGQAMPEVLREGTLQEQLDYIHNRTLIYENFRAIREDMFQQIRRNSVDSLNAARQEVYALAIELNNSGKEIDSLLFTIQNTRNELNQAVENRDSISFLGIPLVKATYNLIVWSIIAGLAVLLVFGLLLFYRNRTVTVNTLNQLTELEEEFEKYKKNSREQREKLVMDHFNEIKKYKEQTG
jgi:hypothetical protein